jgi:hypothetical protein
VVVDGLPVALESSSDVAPLLDPPLKDYGVLEHHSTRLSLVPELSGFIREASVPWRDLDVTADPDGGHGGLGFEKSGFWNAFSGLASQHDASVAEEIAHAAALGRTYADKGEPGTPIRLSDRSATVDLTKRIVDSLGPRILRSGQLDLFAVAEAAKAHVRPDVVMAAVLGLLARTEQAGLVRTLIERRMDPATGSWEGVDLTELVEQRFTSLGQGTWDSKTGLVLRPIALVVPAYRKTATAVQDSDAAVLAVVSALRRPDEFADAPQPKPGHRVRMTDIPNTARLVLKIVDELRAGVATTGDLDLVAARRSARHVHMDADQVVAALLCYVATNPSVLRPVMSVVDRSYDRRSQKWTSVPLTDLARARFTVTGKARWDLEHGMVHRPVVLVPVGSSGPLRDSDHDELPPVDLSLFIGSSMDAAEVAKLETLARTLAELAVERTADGLKLPQVTVAGFERAPWFGSGQSERLVAGRRGDEVWRKLVSLVQGHLDAMAPKGRKPTNAEHLVAHPGMHGMLGSRLLDRSSARRVAITVDFGRKQSSGAVLTALADVAVLPASARAAAMDRLDLNGVTALFASRVEDQHALDELMAGLVDEVGRAWLAGGAESAAVVTELITSALNVVEEQGELDALLSEEGSTVLVEAVDGLSQVTPAVYAKLAEVRMLAYTAVTNGPEFTTESGGQPRRYGIDDTAPPGARSSNEQLPVYSLVEPGPAYTATVEPLYRPLRDRTGRVVGVSFMSGAELARAQEWARATEAERNSSTLVDTDYATLAAMPPEEQAQHLRTEPGPWTEDTRYAEHTFFVDVHGNGAAVSILYSDGTTRQLTADQLADLLMSIDEFRWVHGIRSVTLLSCAVGPNAGAGTFAFDLFDALGRLGRRVIVHAPTGRIVPIGNTYELDGLRNTTAIFDRGEWLTVDIQRTWLRKVVDRMRTDPPYRRYQHNSLGSEEWVDDVANLANRIVRSLEDSILESGTLDLARAHRTASTTFVQTQQTAWSAALSTVAGGPLASRVIKVIDLMSYQGGPWRDFDLPPEARSRYIVTGRGTWDYAAGVVTRPARVVRPGEFGLNRTVDPAQPSLMETIGFARKETQIARTSSRLDGLRVVARLIAEAAIEDHYDGRTTQVVVITGFGKGRLHLAGRGEETGLERGLFVEKILREEVVARLYELAHQDAARQIDVRRLVPTPTSGMHLEATAQQPFVRMEVRITGDHLGNGPTAGDVTQPPPGARHDGATKQAVMALLAAAWTPGPVGQREFGGGGEQSSRRLDRDVPQPTRSYEHIPVSIDAVVAAMSDRPKRAAALERFERGTSTLADEVVVHAYRFAGEMWQDERLDLTAVSNDVAQTSHPEFVWTAALTYLAGHPRALNTITEVVDRYRPEAGWVWLPAAARARFTVTGKSTWRRAGQVVRPARLVPAGDDWPLVEMSDSFVVPRIVVPFNGRRMAANGSGLNWRLEALTTWLAEVAVELEYDGMPLPLVTFAGADRDDVKGTERAAEVRQHVLDRLHEKVERFASAGSPAPIDVSTMLSSVITGTMATSGPEVVVDTTIDFGPDASRTRARPQDTVFSGVDERGRTRYFTVGQVIERVLRDDKGEATGVSYSTMADPSAMTRGFPRNSERRTTLHPDPAVPGVRPSITDRRSLSMKMPWDTAGQTFYVDAHGLKGTAAITVQIDGTELRLQVHGDVLAKLVLASSAFLAYFGRSGVEAFALYVCFAAAAGPDGTVAEDFRGVLVEDDFDVPVHAPDSLIATQPRRSRDGGVEHAWTVITDGGVWVSLGLKPGDTTFDFEAVLTALEDWADKDPDVRGKYKDSVPLFSVVDRAYQVHGELEEQLARHGGVLDFTAVATIAEAGPRPDLVWRAAFDLLLRAPDLPGLTAVVLHPSSSAPPVELPAEVLATFRPKGEEHRLEFGEWGTDATWFRSSPNTIAGTST